MKQGIRSWTTTYHVPIAIAISTFQSAVANSLPHDFDEPGIGRWTTTDHVPITIAMSKFQSAVDHKSNIDYNPNDSGKVQPCALRQNLRKN